MKRMTASFVLLAAVAGAQEGSYKEKDFLSRVRRLTFEGRRAGEGYFSPDGKHIVFQSERDPENPFFQIYDLDLSTGESKRISPGTGKTTCAFFQPGTGNILFGSTHHDPRSLELQKAGLEMRASGKERRYSWDYDPEMELYVHEKSSGVLRRLTHNTGYDAEASYSPDGKWIVFSSMRDGYSRKLSPEEKRTLEINPAYFAEIYVMKADGSEERRLTETPGYDGGPFFFPDGSRIVWRRFDAEGLIADIFSMKPDGTDAKQLTDFGSMSWAPYLHPSGEYLFFASNKLGFENFELYVVDTEGTKEPVRITYTDGFDGLPVPSPDGGSLAWTSNRDSGGGGQIYLGRFDHQKAREALQASPLRSNRLGKQPTIEDHVEALASEEMEGRLTGSEGARNAADYIAKELSRVGARPLPGRESFRVPFEFTAGVNDLGTTLARNEEPAPTGGVRGLSFSDTGQVSGTVVFAGYGITVPEGQDFGYDSYHGLDVKDRIVLVLRYFPEDAPPEAKSILARYSGLRFKALNARERGAAGLLVVTGPRSPNAGELAEMSFDSSVAGSGIVAASLRGDVAESLFERVEGKTLAEAQKELDSGNPHVTGFAIPDTTVTLDVRLEKETRTAENVVGFLPATTRGGLGDGFVVVGAHYDHLGRGKEGNSLAGKDEVGQIHPGADDNASGVAAVLDIARKLSTRERSANVAFALWSGEELGLLGSGEFVRAGVIPGSEIAAYVNFDMVGRMTDNKLILQAVGTSSLWTKLIEETNVPVGFDVQLSQDPYLPTDVGSFNQAKVPSINFFTGSHKEYHRPADRAELINYEDLERVAEFGTLLTQKLAGLDTRPDFVQVARTRAEGGSRDTLRVFTGTIPDYATEVEGLLLSGVIGGGPAEEAGLRGGDVIVEFAGQRIANVYDYTYALDVAKIGEPIRVVFLRDGERKETTLTPRARK